MSTSSDFIKQVRNKYLRDATMPELVARLDSRPLTDHPLQADFPSVKELVRGGTGALHASLKSQGFNLPRVKGEVPPVLEPSVYERNIENFVGLCSMPVGLAGPLRLNGLNASGDFLVPLATTEAALVASYHRGCRAVTLAGGVSTACVVEKIGRAPVFTFSRLAEALSFCGWLASQENEIRAVAESTSRFAKLIDSKMSLNGRDVVLFLEFSTGDASGQNMVTIATDAVCRALAETSPVPMRRWYIESNMSGDKKATALSFISTRGKRVTAEAKLSPEICREILLTSPQDIYDAWKVSMVSSLQCGALGSQGHYANGLTALFIATGQDVACIAEAAVGITEFAVEEDGSLLVTVCLPSLVVGTVGGGTSLPTQRECLELMDCYGEGKASKFAEICAGITLAGELSIISAIASGHFAKAHRSLARGKKK